MNLYYQKKTSDAIRNVFVVKLLICVDWENKYFNGFS